MNTTIHQKTTTRSGNEASYGHERGTTWIALDHGKNCRSLNCATPTWTGGLARIRAIIADHGITILPEHMTLFGLQPLPA